MSLRPLLPAAEPISAAIRVELLRLCLRLGRVASFGHLAFALPIALLLALEGRSQIVLPACAALVVLLVVRALCAQWLLADDARLQRFGSPLYGALAALEGALWGAALLLLPVQEPTGHLLQLALTVGVLFGTLAAFGAALQPWFAFAIPLVAAQAVAISTSAFALRPVIALAWLLAVVSAALGALWLRRTLGAYLALRDKADRALHQQQRALAEARHGGEQLRLALEAIDAGIADTDLETGERFFSSRYAEMLGYRERASFLQAYRFTESIHPDDRRRVLRARSRHLAQGLPFREEFRMRTASLDYLWVQARGESVRNDEGRATRFVMSLVDITERRSAQQQLAASEQRYRALVQASPSLIWTCDARGRLTFVSERAARMLYGQAAREMIGRHVWAYNAPSFGRREFLRRFAGAFRGRPVFDAELVQHARDGQLLHLSVSAVPALTERGEVEAVLGVCNDITTLKQRERELNEALRNQQAVFDAAGEGIAFVRDQRIERANRALANMLAVPREWLIGRRVEEVLAQPETWAAVHAATVAAALRGEAAIHELMMRALEASGRSAWCQLTSRLIERGAAAAMILVLTDITALKRREELAWHQANHDELTGLPNRRLLVEHARRLLSVAMRRKRLAAVMVLDLDGFKDVNDVFGHACGDTMLRRIALRLSSVLREYDVVARTGGDEFVALLPEIEQPADAIVVAEKMIAAASENLDSPGRTLRIAASVGIGFFPADGQDFDALLRRADTAMYAAKAAGKSQFRLASDAAGGQSA